MKRITYFILLATFALSVLGCKKEIQPIDLTLELSSADQGVTFENDVLKINSQATDKDAVLVLKEANGQDFSTESLRCELDDQNAGEWCTVAIKGKEIHVSTTENVNKESSRKTDVSIVSGDGLINPLGFTIEQAPKAKSSSAQLLAFSLEEQSAPATIDEETKIVSINVVRGTDITELTPTIEVSPGASIVPGSGEKQDFTSAVTYTVTAEDGKTTAEYKVNVNKEYGPDADKAQILSFSLKEQEGPAIIDNNSKSVSITVKYDTDLSSLTPTIEITDGATISPKSGERQDFTSPVEYTVISENGSVTAKYLVTVKLGFGPDADKAEFLTFNIKDQMEETMIDNTEMTVSVTVPTSVDLTNVQATATFTRGATISPAIEEVTNYSNPVEFVLTSEDGTTVNTYTVTVTAKKNSKAFVESFIVGDESKGETVVEGDIDNEAGTIVLNMPYSDKWPWGYTAKYEAVLSPGATGNMAFNNWDWSFAYGATYTVTSEDESTVNEYIITTNMAKNPNADLISMTVFDPETNGQPKGIYSVQIDNTARIVNVNIKEGADVSDLHVKIETSKGATTSWKEDETLNLASAPTITVTSEDGEHSNTYSFKTSIVKLSDFNLEMIDVEAAGHTFVFGDNSIEEYKKDYAQDVTLSKDFQISKFEITQDIFTVLMGINNSPTIGDDYPITNINWYEAAEFCNRLSELAGLTPVYEFSDISYNPYTGRINTAIVKYDHANATGYRLPTSAEFEWAAKGGIYSKGYPYAGGDTPGDVAWYEGNSAKTNKKPQPVGGKDPNELGIYDMSGNADEWVYDWKMKIPWGEIPDFAEIDPIGGENPSGLPTWEDYRIFRGGAASSAKMNVSVSETRYCAPNEQSQDRGFRIVITKAF